MARERIILGTVGGVCVILLAAVLLMPRGPGRTSGNGEEPVAAAAGGSPPEGAAPAGSPAAGESPTPPAETPPAATPTAPESATPAPPGQGSFLSEQNRRDVSIFFQEKQGESLAPEKHKIFLTSSPVDQAKQIVVELIGGPHDGRLLPTFPPETRLLGLYLDRSGTAYVDFSKDLVTLHPGGTSEELATIFSLVDSLTYNLPEIRRVHLLVEGAELDTLKEHLDLRRDYLPDMSIVDLDGMK